MTNIRTRLGEYTFQIDMLNLELAFLQNLTVVYIEYGGIGLDPKRPFGNSFVEEDILEIIGVEPNDDYYSEYSQSERDYAAFLYGSLIEWLKSRYEAQAEFLISLLKKP